RAGGAWVVAIGLGPLGHLQIGALASLFGVGVALGTSGAALVTLALAGALLFPRVRRLGVHGIIVTCTVRNRGRWGASRSPRTRPRNLHEAHNQISIDPPRRRGAGLRYTPGPDSPKECDT